MFMPKIVKNPNMAKSDSVIISDVQTKKQDKPFSEGNGIMIKLPVTWFALVPTDASRLWRLQIILSTFTIL